MTPLQIEILMHYHYRGGDYSSLVSTSHSKALQHLSDKGYLEKTVGRGQKYSPTEKLHLYCEALCNVPEPVQKWVVEL